MTAGIGLKFNKIIINPRKYMNKHSLLRKYISVNDKELIIYGTDKFSQFSRRDASVSSDCDRALPVACKDDLVVLRGQLDLEYHNWLRSHGLASDYAVDYKTRCSEKTLA